MALSDLLLRARPLVERELAQLAVPCHFFFSLCDGQRRAELVHVSAESPAAAWQKGATRAQQLAKSSQLKVHWLRVDWVKSAEETNWQQLKARLARTKRNYFRYGLALDADLKIAFLEQELNANAMLYGGNQVGHAQLNEKNFLVYAKRRFGKQTALNFEDGEPVYLLHTQGVFCAQGQQPQLLYPSGKNAGRRILETLDQASTLELIESSSRYLATQVQESGRFHYGWHPCFDRAIPTYNALRHASSTYSMLEAWEVTGDTALKAAIDRALHYLTRELIREVEIENGEQLAFLVDQNDEIKLGGNAVCLLALVKYTELTGSPEYQTLMKRLALGVRHMQDQASGQFVHVLHYPDLSVKEDFRIIYYDGEAAFGLMRLYGLTRDPRWLETVELAFEYFIAAKHWEAHDHWLSYCVNELTLYRPQERYYRFGIDNVAGYLDFVANRITTFPTLLELMMAAEKMVTRLRQSGQHPHLLARIDLDEFYRALDKRAHHLLNGHFWPEYAMYFKNPKRILGSFFIRHHGFRVRIDDVEHYLSGYVAYLNYLKKSEPPVKASTVNRITLESRSPMNETSRQLFAKVSNFEIDIDKLRNHFLSEVRNLPSTPYRDNRVDYIGWAVTSRDGSLEDGVKRIGTKGTGNRKRGIEKTPVCVGYLEEVIQALKDYGLSPYRARIMQLVSNGETMPFHKDSERETWRLHIPIITNDSSFFEWRREDGRVESIHLPADGSAWLVRVDVEHRAVNLSDQNSERVHLLMGLNEAPRWEMLTSPMIRLESQQTSEIT